MIISNIYAEIVTNYAQNAVETNTQTYLMVNKTFLHFTSETYNIK